MTCSTVKKIYMYKTIEYKNEPRSPDVTVSVSKTWQERKEIPDFIQEKVQRTPSQKSKVYLSHLEANICFAFVPSVVLETGVVEAACQTSLNLASTFPSTSSLLGTVLLPVSSQLLAGNWNPSGHFVPNEICLHCSSSVFIYSVSTICSHLNYFC